jgi:hypothetical protein
MVYVIQVCRTAFEHDPDDGQRNCPKHVVLFHNKFEKLVRLVGFIIRTCHDAWSHERKKKLSIFVVDSKYGDGKASNRTSFQASHLNICQYLPTLPKGTKS